MNRKRPDMEQHETYGDRWNGVQWESSFSELVNPETEARFTPLEIEYGRQHIMSLIYERIARNKILKLVDMT